MNARRGVLIALLVATLAAVWWVGEGESPSESVIVAAARRAPALAKPARLATVPAVAAAKPEPRFPGGGPDLFPAVSWRPPPPPPVVVASPPPPPPMAPPLPFKFVGRWVDEQGETVFLASGERVLSARAGQILEQWRLDKVSENSLTFTYVPLNQQRQLRWTP